MELISNQLITSRILRIAIPSPVRRLFDYILPSDLFDLSDLIGQRVIANFGAKRLVTGVIVEEANISSVPINKLKAITSILDTQRLFDQQLQELIYFAANYYHFPIGMIYHAALPAWLRKAKSSEIDLKQKSKNIKIQEIQLPTYLLNTEQITAIETVEKNFNNFACFLLDGVTGSGKTEVYLNLINKILSTDKQVLVLVPEINLTPQTIVRFQQRFECEIAVIHSQISEKSRGRDWLKAQRGTAKIIIGTRSAAFVPIKSLGLIVIDEEHDLSYKQQDHLRYSARDLLLKRAQIANCPIVLGTATPSLESWHNVKLGKYQHLSLRHRAGNAMLPEIKIIDIRHKKLNAGISALLIDEIKNHLARKKQVLIFINRRGYAPIVLCYACGWHQNCERCSSNMIYHYSDKVMRCHHCLAERPLAPSCPDCGNNHLSNIGVGTQRIEQAISEIFSDNKILRIDRDTVNTKNKLAIALEKINSAEVEILIGTQMLAKGHHFPNITLVAILDLDGALFSADFRATERMGQLLMQVAGRSGRGDDRGQVILQTTNPSHPLLTNLLKHNYHGFIEQIYEERKNAELPPFTYQAMFRAEHKNVKQAENFLLEIKQLINSNSKFCLAQGPCKAPLEKRTGMHRLQLLLTSKSRGKLQECLNKILDLIDQNHNNKKIRWSLDVDPLDFF